MLDEKKKLEEFILFVLMEFYACLKGGGGNAFTA